MRGPVPFDAGLHRFWFFIISVFRFWVCLSGLAPPVSVVFELFQSSSESGDGLSQLVDFLFLLGYLRLDAGRIPGGEIFERQSFGDVAPVSRHHALVASDGHVDVHMAELVHGLAQCAALDHEHRRVCRAQGVERHVLAVDSFPSRCGTAVGSSSGSGPVPGA